MPRAIRSCAGRAIACHLPISGRASRLQSLRHSDFLGVWIAHWVSRMRARGEVPSQLDGSQTSGDCLCVLVLEDRASEGEDVPIDVFAITRVPPNGLPINAKC